MGEEKRDGRGEVRSSGLLYTMPTRFHGPTRLLARLTADEREATVKPALLGSLMPRFGHALRILIVAWLSTWRLAGGSSTATFQVTATQDHCGSEKQGDPVHHKHVGFLRKH